MKKFLLFMLAVAVALSLIACSATEVGKKDNQQETVQQAESSKPSSDVESKGIIAFSAYEMSWEYYVTLSNGVKDAAEAAGYKYVNHDQQSDQNTMIQGCTDLINQGIACLVLTPCKPEATKAIYDLAAEKNIPVILADIQTDITGYLACLKTDNYHGGEIAAEFALKKLAGNEGSKKFACITVDPSNTNIVRSTGAIDVMTAAGWTCCAELAGMSEPDVAYACMQDILTANPDVRVVFASNDPMAIAASQAISDAGLVPGKDVYIVGYDAQTNVMEPIDKGEILGTVAQDPYGMGANSVATFLKWVAGEPLAYDDPDTNLIYTDVWIVSKENVQDYLP